MFNRSRPSTTYVFCTWPSNEYVFLLCQVANMCIFYLATPNIWLLYLAKQTLVAEYVAKHNIDVSPWPSKAAIAFLLPSTTHSCFTWPRRGSDVLLGQGKAADVLLGQVQHHMCYLAQPSIRCVSSSMLACLSAFLYVDAQAQSLKSNRGGDWGGSATWDDAAQRNVNVSVLVVTDYWSHHWIIWVREF